MTVARDAIGISRVRVAPLTNRLMSCARYTDQSDTALTR
jgi:hypothetical protein